MRRVFIEDGDSVFEDTAEGSSSKRKSVKQTPSSNASERNVIIYEEIMSANAFGIPGNYRLSPPKLYQVRYRQIQKVQ